MRRRVKKKEKRNKSKIANISGNKLINNRKSTISKTINFNMKISLLTF
jgi:hypothetical protein